MGKLLSSAVGVLAVLVGFGSPAGVSAPAVAADTHVRYTVTDLGTFGTQFGFAEGINDQGWVTGFFGGPNQHAFLWRDGTLTDLGTLGGPNSGPGDFPLGQEPGARGQTVGAAETSAPDPLAEGFCNFLLFSPATDRICLPVIWQNGVPTVLSTLGGTNGGANDMNRRGQVVGTAENRTPDSTCSVPHLQTEPVTWDKGGVIHELPTRAGDPGGVVNAINDEGQAVGATGNCSSPFHAVLWENGKAIDLGNLGGTSFMALEATDINNQSQVVGFSDLPGDATFDAFRWQNGAMSDLGTLPGDFGSLASAINDQGQVVGTSFDASGNLRGFIWQNGTMTDLNTLSAAGSPLFLLQATGINSRGQIVGQALQTSSGEMHAFLATPEDGDVASGTAAASAATGQKPHVVLPENVRKMLWQRLRFNRFGAQPAWAQVR